MACVSEKATSWTCFLAGFWVAFSLMSPPAHAWEPGPNPISSIDEAHKAVWKIQNFAPGVRFGSGKGHSTGTTFAISERYFVTNFHVWNDLVNRNQALEKIHLMQRGHSRALKVHKLLAVSGTYDIALFETKGSVEKYLGLAKDPRLEKAQPLSALGYPEGVLAHVGQMWGTHYYEDAWVYGFGNYHYTGFGGMSGGPVLNGRGEAIGMEAQSDANVTYAIKLEYLHKLLSSKIGVVCSRPFRPGRCIRDGKEKVKRGAATGNAVARYQLGRGDSYVNETSRDRAESLDWLEASARNGFPPAMRRLANLKVHGQRGLEKDLRSAASLYEGAAARGEPAAIYTLVQMYYYGIGKKKDIDKAFEVAKPAVKLGYFPVVKFLESMRRENPWLR